MSRAKSSPRVRNALRDVGISLADFSAKARRTQPAPMEAVAWRVKDYADGWILFRHEAPARKSGEARNGALVQPLYTHPPQPDVLPGDLRERVGKLIEDWPFRIDGQDGANELADAILAALGSRSKASVPTEGGQAAVLDVQEPGPISSADLIAATDRFASAIDDRGGGRGA